MINAVLRFFSKPIWKSLSVILLCFASAKPTTQLFPKYTPITSRMMVYAIGIDDDGGDVRITLAANNVESPSEADVVSAKGKTFYDALTEAEKAASKEIFLGHTSIILIGQQAARESLAGFIDYTARNFRMRMNIKMLTVMGGTAKEILDLKGESGNNILSKLDSLISTVTIDENNSKITLNNVVKSMASDMLDPVTVAVKTITNEDDGQKELSLAGFALYKDVKLEAFITDEIADIYGLINGNYRIGSLTLELNQDEKASVEIVTTETKIKFNCEGDIPKAEVIINITCGIAEHFGKNNSAETLGDELINQCTEQMKNKLENEAKELIDYTKEAKVDVFGIVYSFYKSHPYKMQKFSKDPKALYSVMEIDVAVIPTVTNSYVMQKNE